MLIQSSLLLLRLLVIAWHGGGCMRQGGWLRSLDKGRSRAVGGCWCRGYGGMREVLIAPCRVLHERGEDFWPVLQVLVNAVHAAGEEGGGRGVGRLRRRRRLSEDVGEGGCRLHHVRHVRQGPSRVRIALG